MKAAKAGAPDAYSVYDAIGNRVAAKVNDNWQYMVYDAFGKLVSEYGGQSNTDEGGVKYLLSDWQGSLRAAVNNAGFVSARMDYQAFGETLSAGIGRRTAIQGFTGGTIARPGYGMTEQDSATGLGHAWYRKNETRAGRWTSPDPYNGSATVVNPQTFNRYSYAVNQPTNFVDPSGLIMVPYRCFCVDGSVPGYQDPNPRCQTCYFWVSDAFFFRLPTDFIRRGPDLTGPLGSQPFDNISPQESGKCGVNPVTGVPGLNRQPYNQQGNLRSDNLGSGEYRARRRGVNNAHKGIDIFGQLNQPVVAAIGGTVTRVDPNNGGYGQTVEITGPGGIVTKYHHLSSITVSEGDGVGAGQGIGTLGQTGNAGGTNPHVDFEVTKNGRQLDPGQVLNSPCP